MQDEFRRPMPWVLRVEESKALLSPPGKLDVSESKRTSTVCPLGEGRPTESQADEALRTGLPGYLDQFGLKGLARKGCHDRDRVEGG